MADGFSYSLGTTCTYTIEADNMLWTLDHVCYCATIVPSQNISQSHYLRERLEHLMSSPSYATKLKISGSGVSDIKDHGYNVTFLNLPSFTPCTHIAESGADCCRPAWSTHQVSQLLPVRDGAASWEITKSSTTLLWDLPQASSIVCEVSAKHSFRMLQLFCSNWNVWWDYILISWPNFICYIHFPV